MYLAPRPICTECFSKNLVWTQLERRGKLVTYTVIHMALDQFKDMVPYPYGIIELKNGLRFPSIIRNVNLGSLRVGTELEVDFDTEASSTWRQWLSYFFKPP